jgi:hypothetical protein
MILLDNYLYTLSGTLKMLRNNLAKENPAQYTTSRNQLSFIERNSLGIIDMDTFM